MRSRGNCIIRNSATGQEIGYYDTVDKGMAALSEMVQANPLNARLLSLIVFEDGQAVDSILGEELLDA